MSNLPRCKRAIPITPEEWEVIEDKMIAKEITLNGKPAQIAGCRLPFGKVRLMESPFFEVEYAWETIISVCNRDGKFKA